MTAISVEIETLALEGVPDLAAAREIEKEVRRALATLTETDWPESMEDGRPETVSAAEVVLPSDATPAQMADAVASSVRRSLRGIAGRDRTGAA